MATFDFYYGENLGPCCTEFFSAVTMHTSNAFNGEPDRIDADKNAGKLKVRKMKTLSSNDPT